MLRFKSIKVNVNVNDVDTKDCVCSGKELESESESRSVVSDSLGPHVLCSPWNSPGQNTGVGACSHEIKRCLLLERKVMTNLDSVFKSRDITLPTKVHLVMAMVFSSSHVWM